MKKGWLLLLLLVWVPLLVQLPEVDAGTGLGPMVNISYQMGNKTFHEIEYYVEIPSSPDYVSLDPRYSQMMENDGHNWQFLLASSNTSQGRFRVEWKFLSPYTELKAMHYDFKGWGVDVEEPTNGVDVFTCQIYVFTQMGHTSVSADTHNTFSTGSANLNRSYVQDGFVHGLLYMNCENSSSTLDRYYFIIDQLVFEYDPITESKRSIYTIFGDYTYYEVAFTTWDYNVNTTLTIPSGWVFDYISPSMGTNGDGTEFACLVPLTYTVFYYDDELWFSTPLYLTDFGIEVSYYEIKIWLATSWRNATVTIIDSFAGVNTTQFNAQPEFLGSWTYGTQQENGNHTIFLIVDGGADCIERQFVYEWKWYVPTEPLDIIGVGPSLINGLRLIASNQFLQALIFGAAIFGLAGALMIWRRRDNQSVYVDEVTGLILHKKHLIKKKIKVRPITRKEREKSIYDEMEALLERDEDE